MLDHCEVVTGWFMIHCWIEHLLFLVLPKEEDSRYIKECTPPGYSSLNVNMAQGRGGGVAPIARSDF